MCRNKTDNCYLEKEENRDVNDQSTSVEVVQMFSLSSDIKEKPLEVDVKVANIPLKMELDTGAGASVLSSFLYRKMFSHVILKKTDVRLRTYDGNYIQPLGQINVPMRCNNKLENVRLLVIEGGCEKPLFGRDLLKIFKVEISLNKLEIRKDECVKRLVEEYNDVYETIDLKLKEPKQLVSDVVLVHFNPSLPVKLVCDASKVGIAAVLLHKMADGTERPIGWSSRVLSKAEQNYLMIQKEALALYWGVKKFSQFLMGRKFELVTDHKNLLSLFGENKSLPKVTAGRIQRWALYLSGYNYKLKLAKGSSNEADEFSRLPIPADIECENLNFLNVIPVDIYRVKLETRKDRILGQLITFIEKGRPDKLDQSWELELKSLYNRRNELYVHNGIVMWGSRLVMPFKLSKQMLEQLHSTHLGMSKMKITTRSYFWWPGFDSDIENLCSSCITNNVKDKVVSLGRDRT
ncbi:hypothetical protein ILUMI_13346 [Ignelater luminosus]|uniref:RNA-directed DNA polymerase n=1 Tax=Ignelater luminosus TaxID=2038154 RepID=A0A8K0GC28_IGNLU|nr:hypothetical protein ILUMI_13346 [Ignelater luminosus]